MRGRFHDHFLDLLLEQLVGQPSQLARVARPLAALKLITNLKQNPQWIYEQVYCARGDIENRLKELHHGLEINRMSCAKFWAN